MAAIMSGLVKPTLSVALTLANQALDFQLEIDLKYVIDMMSGAVDQVRNFHRALVYIRIRLPSPLGRRTFCGLYRSSSR